MFKIVNKNDLDVVKIKSKSPEILIKYVEDYFNEMLSRFKCKSLERFGSIFLLDSQEDVENSKLSDFLIRFPPQHVCGFVLLDSNNTPISITQILLNANGFAFNIFAQEKFLKEIVKNNCIFHNEIEVV